MSILTIKQLESLALKDPLSYGIIYIDLLESKKWEIASRPWLIEPYSVVNPYHLQKNPINQPRKMAIMKSAQCGFSTMGIVRQLHFSDFWPSRSMYMLPREPDVQDFVSTRINPILEKSDRLSRRLGEPNHLYTKKIGESYLFYSYATIEPRMMPIDALFADEVDLSDPSNVSTAVNRMDASQWGLEYYFSTPTVSNYGIHAIYLNSDMRRWIVKCKFCSHEQYLQWEQNLKFVGAANNPTKVFYGCAKCGEDLDREILLNGKWIAEKPDLSNEIIGFHVSQMMIYNALKLYKLFRDPQTKLLEFYRKRLGVPYELGEGSLERDDIIVNCYDEPYQEEDIKDGVSRYYMGVDQGNELQVLIAKISDNTKRPKIIHIELIPIEDGFDRVWQLIRIFNIKRAVIDGNPNRHSVHKGTTIFPGKVIAADYIEQRKRYTTQKESKKGYIISTAINRTEGFDHLFEQIRNGYWMLPGNPPNLPPRVELLIDHTTALRRDIEIRKTRSGEINVGVYRSIRNDHLAHAWLYLQTAIDIDKRKNLRAAIIDINKESANDEQENKIINNINKDTIVDIIYYLAEVPKEQLSEYINNYNSTDYKLPFPLNYKLQKAQQKYDDETINAVIEYMLDK